MSKTKDISRQMTPRDRTLVMLYVCVSHVIYMSYSAVAFLLKNKDIFRCPKSCPYYPPYSLDLGDRSQIKSNNNQKASKQLSPKDLSVLQGVICCEPAPSLCHPGVVAGVSKRLSDLHFYIFGQYLGFIGL